MKAMNLRPSDQEYVAGVAAALYPGLGEPLPPGGAKVLLLTMGGVWVSGPWSNDGRYQAWSPLPARSEYTYPTADGVGRPGSGTHLLLTLGDVCVFGPWSSDGRYKGWASLPARDRAKEDALAQMFNLGQEWRLAA